MATEPDIAVDVAARLNRLVDQQEVKIAQIFRTAISQLKNELDLDDLADLLAQGHVNEAIDRLRHAADALAAQSNVAFVTSGQSTADFLTGAGIGRIVFDQINLNAVAAMQANRLHLIRDFNAEQIRATSQALIGAVESGTNPIAAARNFRDSVGLTEKQWGHVQSYREALGRVGTDNAAAQNALGRALRDGRGDKSVLAAARNGRPLPPEKIDWMVRRYADRYVKHRAEAIGRTEAMRAVNQGNEEGYRQAIADGTIRADQLRREWRTRLDGRERKTHRFLNTQERGWGETWVTENGELRYPGDPDAPGIETIQCFPSGVVLSSAGAQRVITRYYSGELIELVDGSGVNLPITPNHPVLTQRGWIAAGLVVEGDYLVNCLVGNSHAATKPDIENGYAFAQDLASLAKFAGDIDWPESATVNLHGEVPNHQVEVIAPPSELRNRWKVAGEKLFGKLALLDTDIALGHLLYPRLTGHLLRGSDLIESAIISGLCERLPFVRSEPSHTDGVSLATASHFESKIAEAGVHALASSADLTSNLLDREALAIQERNLIVEGTARYCGSRVHSVLRRWHDGPVFTLETDNGIIIANGKVVHNCRCALLTRIKRLFS